MSRKYKHGDRVPSQVLAQRLVELADIVSREPQRIPSEFVMRIPAELDRCPDLVMSQASSRLIELESEIKRLKQDIRDWENDFLV